MQTYMIPRFLIEMSCKESCVINRKCVLNSNIDLNPTRERFAIGPNVHVILYWRVNTTNKHILILLTARRRRAVLAGGSGFFFFNRAARGLARF